MPEKADSAKKTGAKPRLSAADWADEALALAAERGVEGIRIDVLAQLLGVTKGSFYWHFRDRDALLAAMLDGWRRRATLQIIERIERSGEPPAERLRRLLRLPFGGSRSEKGASVELAIRLWGQRDEKARAALEEVDRLRLRYIGRLFEEHGLSAAEAEARAHLAYAYMRVAPALNPERDPGLAKRCESALLCPGEGGG